jgi:predicted kinase
MQVLAKPMLITFSGLPGVGKTAIARALALQIGAVYLRIDSIEQSLRDSPAFHDPLNDAGYRAAYAIAEDNLRLGRTVVADSVNPISITRDAWLEVADRTGVRAFEIEVRCSDRNEHQRRCETRASDIPGLRLPTWDEVVSREYHAWDREHVVVDTVACTVEQSVSRIGEMLHHR